MDKQNSRYTYWHEHVLPTLFHYYSPLPIVPLTTTTTTSSSSRGSSTSSLERTKQRLVITLHQINQSRRWNASIPEVAFPRVP